VDSAGDGLSDEEEIKLGFDPANPDSDGDGIIDSLEARSDSGLEPWNPKEKTPWYRIDSDGDGLTDYFEVGYGTDPWDPDSDDDGRLDSDDPHPLRWDPPGTPKDWDGDGLTNEQEGFLGLNPYDHRDAGQARPRVEKLYNGDEIRNADLRQLAGVKPTPEEQAKFDAAVDEALKSADALTRERAHLVIEAITGEDRRTPEHLAELGKAKNALEEVKKNGVPSGKREDILSAIRQLSLLGEDVDENSPLGQQFHGLLGDGERATTHDDPPPDDPPAGGGDDHDEPPSGGTDDPGPGMTTGSGGGGSSWTEVAKVEFTDDDGNTHHAKLWRNDDGTTVNEHWTTDKDGNTTSRTCDKAGGEVVECPDFENERPTHDQVTCDTAGCGRALALLAALGGDPTTDPCGQQACPEPGDDGWGGPVDIDGDGDPELAGWLINTWGVIDPSPMDDGGVVLAIPDDFDPCAGNACPEFGPDGPQTVDPSGPVGDPRNPDPISGP